MPSKHFVQRTISKDQTWVPVSVEKLTRAHLEFWNSYIQPEITAMGPALRVDHDWNWRTLTSVSLLATAFLQRPEAFALVCKNERTGVKVVSALIQLARSYAYFPSLGTDQKRMYAGYLWMCSTAPTQALLQYFDEGELPKRLGQLCIDVAVTASYLDGYEGRICLHADENAPRTSFTSDSLIDFYSSRHVNMKRLPHNIPIPNLRGYLVPNDGRYFYFDEDAAARFSDQFDTYRER